MARTGDRGVPSALEDAFEALTAALYIDGGLPVVKEWVARTVFPAISEDIADTQENPKGALQELVQARGETPLYELQAQEGPPHARTFHVSVSVAGKLLGEGSGGSKREAEAAAAAVALETLETQKKRTRRTRS
jgi:ribonuclease III